MAEKVLQTLGKYILGEFEAHTPYEASRGTLPVSQPSRIPLIPLTSPLRDSRTIPILPLTPIADLVAKEDSGFDSNNFDPRIARVGILNDHKIHGEPHPTSRPLFNAAIPSSPQGFYRPFNY